MTDRTARSAVNQAIADFDDIREAIRGHRVEVPYPTPTSQYAELIAKINSGFIRGRSTSGIKAAFISEIRGKCEECIKPLLIEPVAGYAELIDSVT